MGSLPVRTASVCSGTQNQKTTAVVLPKTFGRRLVKTATLEERLMCAVAELRDSVWSEILHISSCWRVKPDDLLAASRNQR
jgi:hypothetical protein